MGDYQEWTFSAKELGELALPDFCPRCFWIKKHNGNRLPYRLPPPGIFSSIDRFTKLTTEEAFRAGLLSSWIPELENPVGFVKPDLGKFKMHIEEEGIILNGVPDHILELRGPAYAILDYKTARFTEGQQKLLEMYDVQINAYALIAKAVGLEPVNKLLLVYMEPLVDRENVDGASISRSGFSIKFQPFVRTVKKNEYSVYVLIKKGIEIIESAEPPDPRPGCLDCKILRNLTGFRT